MPEHTPALTQEAFEAYMARDWGSVETLRQRNDVLPCDCKGKQGQFRYGDTMIDCPGWRLQPKAMNA